jgi:transcriptional regulator with XRE-family HTH domain
MGRAPTDSAAGREFRSWDETATPVNGRCRADWQHSAVPARRRTQDIAVDRARALRLELGRNLRIARLDADLSLREIARATGISAPQGSRIERGVMNSVSIEQITRMGAAVGLDLSARLYPAGDPIRDAAHAALIERLRAHLHPSLTLLTEVPLPIPGDRRAWDAVIRGAAWQIPAEAETRPRDMQALDRRIALKLRDGGFEDVLLVLLDSAANRRLVRSGAIPPRFSVNGRSALARLAEGRDPGGSAVLLL